MEHPDPSTTTARAALVGDPRTFEEAAKAAERRIYDHDILARAEEQLLAKRIERGDIDAKHKLICHNFRLAKKRAGFWSQSCSHLSSDDLFVAAVEGLNRAAEKFDYRRGFKFSTYAMNWIDQSIRREIFNQENTIRIPVHVLDQVQKIRAIEREFVTAHERKPSTAELAELSDVPAGDIEHLRNLQNIRSLNQRLDQGEGEGTEFGDLLPDTASTDSEAEDNIAAARVRAAMRQLSPTQLSVLYLRFTEGLDAKQTASRLALQRADVRSIERDATRELARLLDADDAQLAA